MTTATATPTARAAALLTTEWDTVRVALLCHASEQREAGNTYWAAQILETYEILRRQTA
jgi:hypothetical protein